MPLNLAIGFHVLIALAVVYLPHLLTPKQMPDETYTVNLINIADVMPAESAPAEAPPQPAASPASPPKAITQPPAKKVVVEKVKVVEKEIALAEPEIAEPTPVVEPAPAEAISIKPSKRKIKAEVVPPPTKTEVAPPPVKTEVKPPPPPKKVERDFSQSRRQKLAEMIRAEQQASEEARILAEEAEIEKRLAEASLSRMNRAAAASRSASSDRASSEAALQSSKQLSALENQYYAAIIARLSSIWSLPETKTWDPSLMATVIITVQKDGQIADSFFEVQSGDKIFDRFVTKALQDVGQLPPIPGALKLQRMEIGLHFKPSGIN